MDNSESRKSKDQPIELLKIHSLEESSKTEYLNKK